MLLKLSNSRLNLQGTNISHLGKRNIIPQTCFEKKDNMLVPRRGYEGEELKISLDIWQLVLIAKTLVDLVDGGVKEYMSHNPWDTPFSFESCVTRVHSNRYIIYTVYINLLYRIYIYTYINMRKCT